MINENEFNLLVNIESRMRQIVGGIKSSIYNRIASVPFKGQIISDGKNGKPFIGIIKLSQLDNSENWSPEYHISNKQAEAVSLSLEACNTAKQLVASVKEMLMRKYVYVNSYRVYLNEETLKIISESDIGKYVIEHDSITKTS